MRVLIIAILLFTQNTSGVSPHNMEKIISDLKELRIITISNQAFQLAELYSKLANKIRNPQCTNRLLSNLPQLANALVVDSKVIDNEGKSIIEIIFEKYLRYRNACSEELNSAETMNQEKFGQYIENKFQDQPEAANRLLNLLKQSSRSTLTENTVEYSIFLIISRCILATLPNCILESSNTQNYLEAKANWNNYESTCKEAFSERIPGILPCIFQLYLDGPEDGKLATKHATFSYA